MPGILPYRVAEKPEGASGEVPAAGLADLRRFWGLPHRLQDKVEAFHSPLFDVHPPFLVPPVEHLPQGEEVWGGAGEELEDELPFLVVHALSLAQAA